MRKESIRCPNCNVLWDIWDRCTDCNLYLDQNRLIISKRLDNERLLYWDVQSNLCYMRQHSVRDRIVLSWLPYNTTADNIDKYMVLV